MILSAIDFMIFIEIENYTLKSLTTDYVINLNMHLLCICIIVDFYEL